MQNSRQCLYIVDLSKAVPVAIRSASGMCSTPENLHAQICRDETTTGTCLLNWVSIYCLRRDWWRIRLEVGKCCQRLNSLTRVECKDKHNLECIGIGEMSWKCNRLIVLWNDLESISESSA